MIAEIPPFARTLTDPRGPITRMVGGAIGGKAGGLLSMAEALRDRFPEGRFQGLTVEIPPLTVVGTDAFDAFLEGNGLTELLAADLPDDRVAHAFQEGELPAELVGDLRALAIQAREPLAVRSSSLLEDAMYRPFAGVYGTKMIPNNQPDPDARFRRLVEAVKLVWASTCFRGALQYMRGAGADPADEKMAVIIQQVVGQRVGERFYPTLSGVARSHNFYPSGGARPEEGVVELALGLGKTIVDEGVSWAYSPAFPRSPPPFNDMGDLMRSTQTAFWSVNMGRPPDYDPTREDEYLVRSGLDQADYDDTLRFVASTYDRRSDRLMPGVARPGPRVLDFAPLLRFDDVPLAEAVRQLLLACGEVVGCEVELEFAATLDRQHGLPARLGFLQVRPMVVPSEQVQVPEDRLRGEDVVAASERVLGNGVREDIRDVVYLRPEAFDVARTAQMPAELERINAALVEQGRPYLLVGFGRWGTSDTWCGVPVLWGQIAGARAIVEVELESGVSPPSQGSHFFHNVTSFQVLYFAVPDRSGVDWAWLEQQHEVTRTTHVRHVRTTDPLRLEVDGRSGRGVILRHG